jgi:hypothetical protein
MFILWLFLSRPELKICQNCSKKIQPLEFGKLDYLKKYHRNPKNLNLKKTLKKYKMAEQSKMLLPTTFFVFSLQLFDLSTDQKN